MDRKRNSNLKWIIIMALAMKISSLEEFFHTDVTKYSSRMAIRIIMCSVAEEEIKIDDSTLCQCKIGIYLTVSF